MIAEFQFLEPLWLLALAPLWALVWLYSRRSAADSNWRRLCDAHLLAEMTRGRARQRGRDTAAWTLAAVLSIGIVAAAAPSWSRLSQPIMEASSARVIVFDLSRSMLVQDVRPSRYQHALAAASEIIGAEFAGETGLVVFAQSAFVLSPLSRDADGLGALIEAVNPDAMPQDGSNLADAIARARELLLASFEGKGQILLISAGDSDDQSAVQAAIEAAADGNRVSVIAIGSDTGGPLLDDKGGLARDSNGRVKISKTNFALLGRVAAAGNGDLLITGAEDYRIDLLTSRLEAGALVESRRSAELAEARAADNGVWLVWCMLLPALLLFRRNLLWVLLVALILPFERDALASEVSDFWQHREAIAYDAFARGDYGLAGEISQNALMRGASFYRSGRYEEALQQFGQLDSAMAFYNHANTLVQLQRYPEALASYRQALAIEPAHRDAHYNLRLLETFLREQANSGGESDDGGDNELPSEIPDSGNSDELRIGIATEFETNPADRQQFGPVSARRSNPARSIRWSASTAARPKRGASFCGPRIRRNCRNPKCSTSGSAACRKARWSCTGASFCVIFSAASSRTPDAPPVARIAVADPAARAAAGAYDNAAPGGNFHRRHRRARNHLRIRHPVDVRHRHDAAGARFRSPGNPLARGSRQP